LVPVSSACCLSASITNSCEADDDEECLHFRLIQFRRAFFIFSFPCIRFLLNLRLVVVSTPQSWKLGHPVDAIASCTRSAMQSMLAQWLIFAMGCLLNAQCPAVSSVHMLTLCRPVPRSPRSDQAHVHVGNSRLISPNTCNYITRLLLDC
jgi:hypothetical protein